MMPNKFPVYKILEAKPFFFLRLLNDDIRRGEFLDKQAYTIIYSARFKLPSYKRSCELFNCAGRFGQKPFID
jgi:hypothetical protein